MKKIETFDDIIVSDQVNHLNPAFYNFLSQMADSIADEIRNPLAGIAGTVSILKEELKDHIDEAKVETIDTCIQRIDSFIEDLYLLTRPINPSFIKLNFASFVEQVVRQYFIDKEIEYKLDFLDNNVYIWADLILLQSSIVNILDNAVDAVKNQGTIIISSKIINHDNRESIALVINDTGTGIKRQNFSKLFTPFFTTKHNGRGLGLVISRNYIMLHKGDISIESKDKIGTKVSIIIPKLPGRE